MNFLENTFGDIINTIFKHLTDERILPLHLVSKKMQILTQENIKETRKFYHNFINKTVEDGEFELFKWACLMKCPIDDETITLAASKKEFRILKYALRWHKIDENILGQIAKNGNGKILEWLKAKDYLPKPSDWLKNFFDTENCTPTLACTSAVENEDVEVLIWLKQYGYMWNHSTSNRAAEKGNIAALKWVIENDCQICPTIYARVPEDIYTLTYLQRVGVGVNNLTCAIAARNKKYITVKWLRSQGAPWDAMTCANLAINGNLEMLIWAREQRCPWNALTCAYAASQGHLEIIKWALKNGCEIDQRACEFAVYCGYYEVAKWIIENGYPIPDDICAKVACGCKMATTNLILHGVDIDLHINISIGNENNLEMLKWLVGRGYKIDESICRIAARTENLEILEWAIHNNYKLDSQTCENAVRGGSLEILKCVINNGCPWYAKTCEVVAEYDYFEILKLARKNGCELNKKVCISAANNGNLGMLKWARKKNCEWDTKVCAVAAKRGYMKILRWAHENGCEWDVKTTSLAAKYGHFNILKYAIANGCPYDHTILTNAIDWDDVEMIKWVIKNCCNQGYIFFMRDDKYSELSVWGKENGFLFSDWDTKKMGGVFSKYIPEGDYNYSKGYVFPLDDITRAKKFVLEKAREELRTLENEINEVSSTQEIEKIADAYFGKVESPNVSDEDTGSDEDIESDERDELSEN